MIGEMGGLGDGLFLIGILLTNVFASQLFSMSVASSIYRYNTASGIDEIDLQQNQKSHAQMNERAKLVQKIERMSELPYRSSLRLNKEDTDTLWK